jgi:hypothetical protein
MELLAAKRHTISMLANNDRVMRMAVTGFLPLIFSILAWSSAGDYIASERISAVIDGTVGICLDAAEGVRDQAPADQLGGGTEP